MQLAQADLDGHAAAAEQPTVHVSERVRLEGTANGRAPSGLSERDRVVSAGVH